MNGSKIKTEYKKVLEDVELCTGKEHKAFHTWEQEVTVQF